MLVTSTQPSWMTVLKQSSDSESTDSDTVSSDSTDSVSSDSESTDSDTVRIAQDSIDSTKSEEVVRRSEAAMLT